MAAKIIAGRLTDKIWWYKNSKIENKWIYKATLTNTTDIGADPGKTRQLLETTKIRVLRRITGKTLLDRERSENVWRRCRVEKVND